MVYIYGSPLNPLSNKYSIMPLNTDVKFLGEMKKKRKKKNNHQTKSFLFVFFSFLFSIIPIAVIGVWDGKYYKKNVWEHYTPSVCLYCAKSLSLLPIQYSNIKQIFLFQTFILIRMSNLMSNSSRTAKRLNSSSVCKSKREIFLKSLTF